MLLKASEVDAPLALCVLVLIVSNGCVAKTVMTPATAPVPNVVAVFCGSPWAFDSSFSWLYDPILTPEVADCFIVVDTSPLYRSRTPCSCAISLMAWKLPLKRFAFFASSILFEISWRVMDRETILTRRSSVFLLEWRQLHSQHIQPPYRRWSHFQSKACRQSPLTLTWLCRMLRTSHSLWTRCPTLLVSWITCGQGAVYIPRPAWNNQCIVLKRLRCERHSATYEWFLVVDLLIWVVIVFSRILWDTAWYEHLSRNTGGMHTVTVASTPPAIPPAARDSSELGCCFSTCAIVSMKQRRRIQHNPLSYFLYSSWPISTKTDRGCWWSQQLAHYVGRTMCSVDWESDIIWCVSPHKQP